MPYETTITLKVLHQDPIPDGMGIDDVYKESISGEYSMDYTWDTQAVDDETCKRRLREQGSDIEFFGYEEKEA